jgi:hypothetical protein
LLYKLKGHKNRSFPISARMNPSQHIDNLICASEDGDVYLWSGVASAAIANSKRSLLGKLKGAHKSSACEYFSAFGGNKGGGTSAAIFGNQEGITIFIQSYFFNSY